MRVTANGSAIELPDGATVRDLVEHLGLGERWVVVERNGEPVNRSSFGDVRLTESDRLEVVRPVQGGSRTAGLDQARLYLVADGSFGPLEAVIAAGVDIVQLREKHDDVGAILVAGERFARAAAAGRVPFIVNDRPDVAYALGADGVHLGQDDLPPRFARELLGPDVLIGRSTHDEVQIEAALAEHEAGWIDSFAVGPVHATPTKQGRPAVGYELLRFAASVAGSIPWFAIGGIDPSNVARVADAGARRIVVVRAITLAPDPVAAVAALLERLPCP